MLPEVTIAGRINAAHVEVQAHAKGMLLAAKEAGELLIKAKERIPHGGFKAWVEGNTRVPYRTARRYMQVAKTVAGDHFDADATIDSVLDTHATRRNSKPTPAFTQEDAEYALKIHARAERGQDHERDVASSKLEKLAKDHGMSAEELVSKARALIPHNDLSPEEAAFRAREQKREQELNALRAEMVRRNELHLHLLEKLKDRTKEEIIKLLADAYAQLNKTI